MTQHDDEIAVEAPAGYKPAKRKRLADQIYEQILQQIVSGDLAEGARLPTESELCRMFQVSRPVVRESLFRLQADGLVMALQGSGTYVQRRPDPSFFSFAPPGGVAGILRCFELRIALEGEAAFHAAQRRTAQDLKMIAQANEQLEEVLQQRMLGTEADIAFHHAIASASHNELFLDALQSLDQLMQAGLKMTRSLSLAREETRLRRVQDEHDAIYNAISSGDADRARTAMRHHIDNARTRLLTNNPEE